MLPAEVTWICERTVCPLMQSKPSPTDTLLITGLFAIALPRALRHFRSGRGDPVISMRMALATLAACRGLFEVVPMSPSADIGYAQASYATLVLVILVVAWVAWPLIRAPRAETRAVNS